MIHEWTILYHSGFFKGRAEFLRLMLEDAQVPYVVSNEKLYGASGLMVRKVVGEKPKQKRFIAFVFFQVMKLGSKILECI
jgi:hypothetical protein